MNCCCRFVVKFVNKSYNKTTTAVFTRCLTTSSLPAPTAAIRGEIPSSLSLISAALSNKIKIFSTSSLEEHSSHLQLSEVRSGLARIICTASKFPVAQAMCRGWKESKPRYIVHVFRVRKLFEETNHCQVGLENNVMWKLNREPSGLAAEVDVGPGVCKQHLHHLRSHRHCQIVTKPMMIRRQYLRLYQCTVSYLVFFSGDGLHQTSDAVPI